MTRASEFCYIAETRDGRMVLGLLGGKGLLWTNRPEEALRINEIGKFQITTLDPSIGFRKVLAG